MPDRHFYWRVRSNAMSFAWQHRQTLEQHYDLMLVTSMVDLSTLRGFLPSLAAVPTLVYFHENQFAYPTRKPSSNIVNAQISSIYTALCANRVVFNSEYNRRSFFAGADELLKRMPDGVPARLLQPVVSSSSVIPVPIDPSSARITQSRASHLPIEIVWNHRWEYDKQPEVLFQALIKLRGRGYLFRIHVVGQQFRDVPSCFENARVELAGCIATWGYQELDGYRQILAQSHIVVSTALHDFQGLSMIEAISYGCVPVAPARVAYPEYIPASLLYQTGTPEEESESLANLLEEILSNFGGLTAPDARRFQTANLIPQYRQMLLAASSRSVPL